MNLFLRCTLLFCSISLSLATEAFSQTGSTTVNSTGVKPKKYAKDVDFEVVETIRQEDKMYQISVWRRIDLREKFNLPLYGSGDRKDDGIMKNIYRAVQSDSVKAYPSDSLGLSKEIGWAKFDSLFKLTDDKTPMRTSDLYFLDIKEDFVFDRHHSQFKFDVKYIALVKAAEVNFDPNSNSKLGPEKTFAYIPYKELMDYFEKKKIQGVWINFKNAAEPRSYVEAFEQRMFRSVVTKFTNEFDKSLLDFTEDDKRYKDFTKEQKKFQAFLEAMNFEYKLIDFENSVWEW